MPGKYIPKPRAERQCAVCDKPFAPTGPNQKYCPGACKKTARRWYIQEYMQAWRGEQPPEYRERENALSLAWSHNNKARMSEKQRDRLQGHRALVLAHYGGTPPSCACCAETIDRFLTVDHVNNDGAEHRREIGGQLNAWLVKQGYPDGFQILCYNCNIAKYLVGACPHQST